MNRFYLVWSPSGRHPPGFRHDTPESAKTEAERLACCNPGQEFFVLAAVSRSLQPSTITERLAVPPTQTTGKDDDIPF